MPAQEGLILSLGAPWHLSFLGARVPSQPEHPKAPLKHPVEFRVCGTSPNVLGAANTIRNPPSASAS